MKSKWKKATLGELVALQRGFDLTTAERSPGDVPVIGGGGLLGHHSAANVKGPGVSVGRSWTIGKVWWTEQDFWAHNTSLFVKDFKGNDARFVFYVLDSIDFTKYNSGGAQPSLNRNFIYPIELAIPPLAEQQKIAGILRTWDEAIDKLHALAIAQRKKQSQAAHALFFDKERGRRKKNGKRLQQLADVTRELTQRNNGLNLGREFVMGVSNSKGIVPMREQSIGGDLSRYKVLPPRAFAYNPMRINVGSIAMSRLDSSVLVSPDYVLFQCVDDRLDPDYLDHLCNTHWWSHHINAGGSGSVRMRTYYDDLAALRLELPDIEEQKKISLYLNAARRENDLIVDQINALERQKRGLMQKLLTGEWRVKC